MKIKVQKYGGPRATMKEMRKSGKHFEDLGNLAKLSLQSFFDYVKEIPYIDDPRIFKNAELVARPKYLLTAKALDCKKKAVLISAWCNSRKIKCKFVATSDKKSKELHHVFAIILYKSKWLVVDATFPNYLIGQSKPRITYYEVL